MSRVRISATVDADELERARKLTGARDSQLLDEALVLLIRERLATQEREALRAQPYDTDPDLAWQAPAGPDLPYDGEIPAEVLALARARRRRR